ncbi:unnamed protein product [Symbiodinium sp. CCMP2592]|nr:unnamed protein product [Symbiodinium sp. CCMP2592]
MNSGDKDSSWLKCQWNGDPGGWADFLRCVRLAFEKTARRKRHLLGPEIVGQLSGRAWVVTQELDHRQLVRRDGVVYLIEFLRDRLCKTPIPDVGLRLEQLMIRLRRSPGTSMATWATQLRDAYRQLQLALARARKEPRTSASSASPTSTPSKPRTSRRTSRGTVEEPLAEDQTEGEQDETETLAGPPDEEELRPGGDDDPPSSPVRTPGSRNSRRPRKDKDSDSDDSVKALADLEIWNRYEEKLEEVLPSELLGWLLLRRAGLSAQARLSVQAASGNSLKLDRVEVALRGMEDELLAQEHVRVPHAGHRRRSFWVEDEGHWSILLADEEDLGESLEGIPLHYVGDETAFNVWDAEDDYSEDLRQSAPEDAYWGDEPATWGYDEDPLSILSAEELQQVEEAYQTADTKLRSFVDARKAVRARHLSRGFYPFTPQAKGFRASKGKGRGRPFSKGKGKGKKGSSPSSPTANMTVPVLLSESSAFAVNPGQAGYSGCFICGDKNHQFRDCPKRSSKGSGKAGGKAGGKVHFHMDNEVYMLTEVPLGSNDTTAPTTSPMATRTAPTTSPMTTRTAPTTSPMTTRTAPTTSPMATRTAPTTSPMVSKVDLVTHDDGSVTSAPLVLAVQEGGPDQTSSTTPSPVMDVPDMILVQKAASGSNLDGFAVLDSGATETVGSLPALESLMLARFESTHQIEEISVTNVPPKRFKFGNGSQDMSSSHVLLPVTLGARKVPMGIYTLDVEGVPLLIGIKTLRRLRSVIDCHRDVLVMGAVDPHRGIQLKRSVTGHLLLDLRQDLMVHSFSLMNPRARVAPPVLPHRDETSYMVQSFEQGDSPVSDVMPALCDPAPESGHVASECVSDHAFDNEVPVTADAFRLEETDSESMRSHSILLSLLALHGPKHNEKGEEQFVTSGTEATKAKPKKGGYKSQPLDWDRTVESDPRDPRHSGPPCNGNHTPAKMYKGSPSGANQYGEWVACERCLLRLRYTPRAGCHALHRSPGALPKDVQSAIQEELPQLTTLKDKDIGWAAAEKSAEDNLQRVRQARMSHQAGLKGAAPKRGSQKGSPTTATPNSPTPAATSPTSSLATSAVLVEVEEIPDGMQNHPGRKAVRHHEETAEAQEYNQRGKGNKDFSLKAMEDFLGQLRAAHAVPQRKFMDKKTTSSFVVSYGLYAHGSQSGVMNSTFQNPHLCKFVNQWLRVWAPSSAQWTTFSIIYNMESKPHRDLHNLKGQPNYVITFGEHENGELWLERQLDEPQSTDDRRRRKPNGSLASGILVSPRHKVIEFTPDRWHATMPWKGTRIALAAFTARSFRDLDPELRRDLLQASFPLPKPTALALSVADDNNQGMQESSLTADEKTMILNDYEEYQDLLFENFEVEDPEASLFGLEICCASPSNLREELQARGEWVQTLGFAEGGDLGTVRGAELVKATVMNKSPRWLVCHVPLGPERKGMSDEMSSSAWRRFSKVVKHLLEVAQVQIDAGGEVLWCQAKTSSARFLTSVRVFWHQHQDHAEGRLMQCGDQGFRSTSTSLLQCLPCSWTAPVDLNKVVARTMQQVTRNDAVFSLIGAVDMTVLDGISAKELGELMERAHRIHSRLGHPSNRLLVKNLQARHADKKLIAAASQLKCDACLESRIKVPRPPVDLSRSDRLWTDLQMDLFHMKIDDRIYHFLLFVDECSGYAVIRLVFDHPSNQGGNATSAQICHLLEEAWTQYFGFPERIKLDAESALRGALLRDWCATRGVELLHAPAEHHQFISEVERSIGTLRRKIETFIRERPEPPRQVALSMVTSHNSLARIHGFSPLQWALGRDLTLSGHANEGHNELSSLSSAGTPGSDLHAVQRLRLRAAQAFLEFRHKDLGDRAARSKASAYQHYLPGDLIYYRRYKTPHDLPANLSTDHPRMTISRWFGPARVLATETRGAPGERRPSSHLWIIAQGRLKKCHYTQVRPASESEHLIAQQSTGTTYPWTMSNLTSMLNKGAYEDMTKERAVYPDDLELPGIEDYDNEQAEEPREGPSDVLAPDSEEELIPAGDASSRKRDAPEPDGEEEMVPGDELIDLNKLFNDPGYMPFQPIPASARVSPYPQESFREQRARHEQEDRPLHVKQGNASNLFLETAEPDKVFAVTIDAPADAQAWKKMVKHPEKFMSKAVSKGVEVSWQRLSAEQRAAMAEAKGLEVAQWVQLKVCKKVAEHVPESQLLRMRWVLTFKEADPDEAGNKKVKAKARIVILGFSDPGLLEDTTASPTMSKLTRQLMLNLACIKQWAIFSADVRTAFLQARPADRGRRLLAKPLPELAEMLELSPQECVELTGSAYGLATAPKEWFADVSATLKRLGALQCRTDPCAWIVMGTDGEVAGALASHVDDFLIMGSATDANWLGFLAGFKAAYTWAPWQQGDFVHCGIRLLQHEDWSVTLDHSSFCADLVQMDPGTPGMPLNDNQVRQAKAILGSAQWRVTQSAPHHAAKLSMLQSLLSSRDGACVDQINKLVREIHSSKHISVQVQNLGQFDPKDATFVAWSDASLANRPDGTSTGGLIIGLMSPKSIEVGQGKANIISWRSYKLPRVARSSLSAEAQALSNCEQELMYARLAWYELNGGKIDVHNPAASTSKVPGHLIIDARGVYDALMKADPGMASFNVKDKYTSLELMGISENIQNQGTILNWCDSDHQLADGLTKSAKQDVLKKFLLQGHWRLRHPGAFMSAKRRRILDGADRSDPLDVQFVAASLLCGSAELTSWTLTERVEKDMIDFGLTPDVVSFGASIAACARAGAWPTGLALFRAMSLAAVESNVVACSSAISACASGGQWQIALQLLAEMPTADLCPDVMLVGGVISACQVAGQWEAAILLLSSMSLFRLSPNSITFNAGLSACERGGEWQVAIQLLSDMPERHIAVDKIGVSSVISACEKGRQWSSACDLLSGFPQARLAADLIVYSSVLSSLAKGSRWQAALGLFAEMPKLRLNPDAVLYSAAISTCGRVSAWPQSLQLLTQMPLEKLKPNEVSFNACISACERGGKWQLGLFLMAQMRSVELSPNTVTYSSAITACRKQTEWQVALLLFSQLRESRLPLDVVAVGSGVSACEEGGAWQLALTFLSDVLEAAILPNLISFNACLGACARASAWRAAQRLLQAMEAGRSPPNAVSLTAAIAACKNAGQWQAVMQLLSMPQLSMGRS